MKRIISMLLVCVVLVMGLFSLASCGALSGTYEGYLCDLKFSGSNVTAIVGDKEVSGTYEIKEKGDDKYTISFDFIESDDDDSSVLQAIDAILGSDVPFSKSDDGKTITIAYALKFTKK